MKSYLIATKREVVTTFRLMGIMGERVGESAYDRFLACHGNAEISVLFVGDGVIKSHEEEFIALKMASRKLLLVIPEEETDFLGPIREQIRQGLGMKV